MERACSLRLSVLHLDTSSGAISRLTFKTLSTTTPLPIMANRGLLQERLLDDLSSLQLSMDFVTMRRFAMSCIAL